MADGMKPEPQGLMEMVPEQQGREAIGVRPIKEHRRSVKVECPREQWEQEMALPGQHPRQSKGTGQNYQNARRHKRIYTGMRLPHGGKKEQRTHPGEWQRQQRQMAMKQQGRPNKQPMMMRGGDLPYEPALGDGEGQYSSLQDDGSGQHMPPQEGQESASSLAPDPFAHLLEIFPAMCNEWNALVDESHTTVQTAIHEVSNINLQLEELRDQAKAKHNHNNQQLQAFLTNAGPHAQQ